LRPSTERHDVPFPDAGEGLQQVFPVIVALEQIHQLGGVLSIEEPESHLHPRLQQALAERIVTILEEQPLAKVVLETHSEVFLLAALRAASGPLLGQVGLFWIETDRDGASTIEAIPVDASGRPATPRFEDAFATMGVMRRQLLADRRARESH
jgi:predicted ATPase